MSRHQLAGTFADLSMARLAYAAGDHEDCLLTLRSIARDVEAFHPTGPDEVFRHRKVTTLVDRLIRKLETRGM